MRFVASTLLDAVRKAEIAPASAARAHAYLCEFSRKFSSWRDRHDADGCLRACPGDFLSILSEIERNYL